jgi:hypothetical protein
MSGKRPWANPFEPDLVFYHRNRVVRYKDNQPPERLFGGYLVFYHLPFPPGLHIRFVNIGKITGVFPDPFLLGSPLACLCAFGPAARLLSVSDPVIRCEVTSTEKTPLCLCAFPSFCRYRHDKGYTDAEPKTNKRRKDYEVRKGLIDPWEG